MHGGGAERGEQDLRPRAGRRQERVGPGPQRLERRGPAHPRQAAAGRGRGGVAHRRPLAEVGELADPGDRLAAVGQVRRALGPVLRDAAATRPLPSAACWPPARSICWNQSQAARASWSVSCSTYQEPPAGSITRARLDSSSSIAWVLRAIRRAKSSGRPSALSKGSTVTASAPPTPAPGRRPWCAACSPTGRARSSSPSRSPRAGAGPRAGRCRRPRRPGTTGGGRRAAWRWSGTGRRRPRSGTPAARPPGCGQPGVGQLAQVGHGGASDRPSSCAAEAPASW